MREEPLRIWPGPLPKVDMTDRLQRLAVAPVLRAVLDDRFPPDVVAQRYGTLSTNFVLTGPDEAELAVLPGLFESTDAAELADTVRRAEAHGLRTLVFSGHDREPVMDSESVILAHPGPTRGGQPRAQVVALPYLFTDRARGIEARSDTARPTVAFCGQGASRRSAAPLLQVRRRLAPLVDRRRGWVPAPPASGHIGLRAAALEGLAAHPGVDAEFVIRDRYRAGASDEADRLKTQAEFDDNLRGATYALCVRGTGNFSARFYEALSFGRVPLFVDTDCMLPFEDEIDWKALTVWVDHREVRSLGDRLVAAHPEVIADPARRPDALRRLWEQRLTSNGYFEHLPRLLRRLI